MAQVMQPQQKEKAISAGQILGLVGSAFGPIGAMAGNMAGSKVDKEQNQAAPSLPQSDNAMSRRLQQTGPQDYQPIDDPGVTLQNANAALSTQSPEMQKRYGPILSQAQMQYQRGQYG